MKEPKFTKGPWIVSKTSGAEIFINHCHENPKRVPGYFAEVRRFITDHEQVNANAHLIAAAPELFEALRCLLEKSDLEFTDGRWPETRNDARAALAKALGEENVG